MTTKYIELAKKLKALADSGVGGEKVNAITMLNLLLKKYNFTLESLEEDEAKDFFINLHGDEFQIWHQITGTVNHKIKHYGPFPAAEIKRLHLKGNHMISCTTAEYLEIQSKYDFYWNLYKEEKKVFLRAFITANNLLVAAPVDKKIDYTDEEIAEIRRAGNLAKNIKTRIFQKQLS